MKRCRENVGECFLDILPKELLLMLLSYLTLVDLHRFFIAYYSPQCGEGGSRSQSHMKTISKYIKPENPREDVRHIYDEILEVRLNNIRQLTSGKYGKLVKGEVKKNLEKIRVIANNESQIDVFRSQQLCMRCGKSFVTRILWRTTARPVSICNTCFMRMERTVTNVFVCLETYKDGWAWISAKQMKKICGISVKTKAVDFAKEHNIRQLFGSDALHYILPETTSSKQCNFFLLDVIPYIKP
jgi:transcription elongation factor Elf1